MRSTSLRPNTAGCSQRKFQIVCAIAPAQCKRTSDDIVLAANEHVSSLEVGRRRNTALHIGLGLAAAAVRPPNRGASNLFVLRIGIEDGGDINGRDGPQQEAGGLESLR